MLLERGGLDTARTLINSPSVSEGYTALWERGRLDLTVEALLFEQLEWQPLFTADEIKIARDRLSLYKYDAPTRAPA